MTVVKGSRLSLMDMQKTFFLTLFSSLCQGLPSYLHLYSILAVFYSIIFQLSLSQSLPCL